MPKISSIDIEDAQKPAKAKQKFWWDLEVSDCWVAGNGKPRSKTHGRILCIPVFLNLVVIGLSFFFIISTAIQAKTAYDSEIERPTTKLSINKFEEGLEFPQVVVCNLFQDKEGRTIEEACNGNVNCAAYQWANPAVVTADLEVTVSMAADEGDSAGVFEEKGKASLYKDYSFTDDATGYKFSCFGVNYQAAKNPPEVATVATCVPDVTKGNFLALALTGDAQGIKGLARSSESRVEVDNTHNTKDPSDPNYCEPYSATSYLPVTAKASNRQNKLGVTWTFEPQTSPKLQDYQNGAQTNLPEDMTVARMYTAGVSRFTFYGLFEAGHEVTEQELLGLSGLMAADSYHFGRITRHELTMVNGDKDTFFNVEMGLAYKEFVTTGPAAASGLEYSLEIVYADLEVEAIVESNEYGVLDVLASVGGISGLFLGWKLLSLVEWVGACLQGRGAQDKHLRKEDLFNLEEQLQTISPRKRLEADCDDTQYHSSQAREGPGGPSIQQAGQSAVSIQ